MADFLGGGLGKGDIVYLSAQTTVEGCGEFSSLAGGWFVLGCRALPQ